MIVTYANQQCVVRSVRRIILRRIRMDIAYGTVGIVVARLLASKFIKKGAAILHPRKNDGTFFYATKYCPNRIGATDGPLR